VPRIAARPEDLIVRDDTLAMDHPRPSWESLQTTRIFKTGVVIYMVSKKPAQRRRWQHAPRWRRLARSDRTAEYGDDRVTKCCKQLTAGGAGDGVGATHLNTPRNVTGVIPFQSAEKFIETGQPGLS